jgi:putative Mn2+ efflux pump MntP
VVSIGLWAFVTTIIGLYLARQLSNKMGPIFTLIAAAILGTMSIQMLSI